MTVSSLARRVLNWLRAGYPEGVPGTDRVPLLALLRNTPLSEDQIREVVREIVAAEKAPGGDGTVTHDEIEKFIADVAHHDGGADNIKRVAARLAAAGWPLAGVELEHLDTAEE